MEGAAEEAGASELTELVEDASEEEAAAELEAVWEQPAIMESAITAAIA